MKSPLPSKAALTKVGTLVVTGGLTFGFVATNLSFAQCVQSIQDAQAVQTARSSRQLPRAAAASTPSVATTTANAATATPKAPATNITIDEKTFPDPHFRAYLIEKYYGRTTLTPDDITNLTTIDTAEKKPGIYEYFLDPKKQIKSLAGIEHFTSLKKLKIANYAGQGIDLSAFTQLEELELLNPAALMTLTLGQKPNLTRVRINNSNWNPKETQISQAASIPLASLDLSGAKQLNYLDLRSTSIKSLDLTHNPCLMHLFVEKTPLTSLNLQAQRNLQDLRISHTSIKYLDTSHNPQLKSVRATHSKLAVVDFSKNPQLKELFVEDAHLAHLDVSKNTQIKKVYCMGNPLLSLTMPPNIALLLNEYLIKDTSKGTTRLFEHRFATGKIFMQADPVTGQPQANLREVFGNNLKNLQKDAVGNTFMISGGSGGVAGWLIYDENTGGSCKKIQTRQSFPKFLCRIAMTASKK